MPRLKTSENASGPVSIRLPARIENLPQFIAPVLALARAQGIDEERGNDLELALEESLVNIFNYAYPEKSGSAGVSCRVENNRLVILIEDEGIAFSITGAGGPEFSSEISERKIGGLGIHLIRSLMDEVRYRREEDRNLLELTLLIRPGEKTP
jgi:anti-sigma regulatory factor (Ser/Thr protein kinase)